MTDENTGEDTDDWHERSPLTDAESVFKHATGVYTVDGEPRDRGIFTHADREYIIGEREYNSRQQQFNVHSRQLKRVGDALQDIQMLPWIEDETKAEFFEDSPPAFLHRVLRDLTKFIYAGSGRDTALVENAVMSAISESEAAKGGGTLRSVDVDISIDHAPDPTVAMALVEDGEYDRLTLEQIGVLAREGLLDAEDYEHLNWPGLLSDPPAPPEPIGEEEEDRDTEDES